MSLTVVAWLITDGKLTDEETKTMVKRFFAIGFQ
jgi:hypothetical protein